jgi:predicted HTH transcriptional regulator
MKGNPLHNKHANGGIMNTESNRIEYKSKLDDEKDKLEREIVAFLNYPGGGHIYIGVEGDGTPVGVENIDATQLKIKDRIISNIEPSMLGLFDIITEKIDRVPVIHIAISAGTEVPYYVKSKGLTPKGCFIRVGSSVSPMPIELIDKMYAGRVRNSLKEITSPRDGQTFELLEIYYRERGKKLDGETFKKTLDLLTKKGDDNYVSYLLADENGVSIKVAKYSGTTKVYLIENDEYGYCSLVKATKSVLHRFEIENRTYAKITSKERLEKRMVDETALREAVINAIVHNDYTKETPPLFEIFSDRIVITSYGGLVSGLSKEEFFKGCSMVRNRELMRVFKDLDLVEQLGSGMRRIMEAYDESIFEFTDNFMFVTFPFENGFDKNNTTTDVVKNVVTNVITNVVTNHSLTQREKQILNILKADNTKTADSMASELGVALRTTQRYLKELSSKGIIVRKGSNKSGYWEITYTDRVK